MSERPEWVVPGAKVAVVTSNSYGGSVSLDMITRVLARDVVLASDSRFVMRGSELRKLGHTSSYYSAPRLLPLDHPDVLAIQERQKLGRATGQVNNAYDVWRKGPTLTRAGELIRAVEAWVALQPQEVSS